MTYCRAAFYFNGERYEWDYATREEAEALFAWAATGTLVIPDGLTMREGESVHLAARYG